MSNNTNELFGEFISAQGIPPVIANQPITIDNNTLYKKLVEIEMEIKSLKLMLTGVIYSPPNYTSYPTANVNESVPRFWQPTSNSIWKSNQTQLK